MREENREQSIQPAAQTAPDAAAARSKGVGAAMLVGMITTTVYTIFSWFQWNAYVVPSWDLGIFTQLAKQYAAFPSTFTVLVAQNVLLGIAARAIAFGAVRLLGQPLGLLFGLAFAFSWGLQGAVEAQFHEIAFAVPLLAFSLTAFLRRQWIACMLWAMPLVFVQEDLGLTVAALGIVLAYRSRRPRGVWLAVWGIGWFGIATLIVLPLLNPDGRWAYAQSLNPAAASTIFLQPEKALTLVLLIVASGAIALRSPLVLLLLPTLAWRFLSDNSGYWGPGWQYSAVLMPILFVAVLDAITGCRNERSRWTRTYGRMAPAVVSTDTHFSTQLNSTQLNSTQRSAAAAAAHAALVSVPDASLVESDIGLMGYLAPRTTVYWVGNTNPTPDYLVVDLQSGGLPAEWHSVGDVAAQVHAGVRFQTIFSRDGYEVAKRIDAAH
ncbi:DUF2079 domain-containing protein [Cryobacterium psychrophilum]|uniref:DUF2079 domain-containing protein n=1 Tax=Cryobacterium psychrophilum TaxID=41988 RepID=A0A4Y8KSD1_9MICO|nr:DUF2079 domain-containing protein [Cryobacterium psychrophilum]TDW29597.1 putative membrane protein DUF2079 [Cryobacterium psychrophilum]TFD81727.1 DUF2079 domain-containing protein [Cryobacterium psychrophilum]